MPRTKRIIDRQQYTTTEKVVGPLTVTKQWNWVGLSVDRTGWTDANALTITAEYSLDDGKTWIHLLGFTCHGGSDMGVESSVEVNNPPPVGALVRARIIATGDVKQDISLIEDDVTKRSA